jgi:hypothetical protein
VGTTPHTKDSCGKEDIRESIKKGCQK